jgi:hypothetical protein
MILDDFLQSLAVIEPPSDISLALAGLWWEAKGDWTRAHESAQQDKDVNGAWVHAYLHRKEGDLSNASYWYARAGRRVPEDSLLAEWEAITRDLLERNGIDQRILAASSRPKVRGAPGVAWLTAGMMRL